MTTLVKLLKVSEYDRLNFDYGYSEGMENAEGSYGILNFYDDDDETYQITSAYGEYWYANYMFRQVKTLESRKHLIGERMIPKLIISTERGLPYDAAYNNIEGEVIQVDEGNIIELKFDNGQVRFYFDHWLQSPVEYEAF